MKTVKNDTRYILKRIIIGVGVALILGLLKTNKVFAMEIQQNYCFEYEGSFDIVECSDTITNNKSTVNLRLLDTPVGSNIFTFYTSISSNSQNRFYQYAFGYENLSNHDLVLMQSGAYKFNLDTPNISYQYFGISNNSGNSYILSSLNEFTDYLMGGYTAVYITQDQGRAFDIVNSNMFNTQFRAMSSKNDYYFIAGYFSSSFDFNNYFNNFSTDWVLNQLNMDDPTVYENFEKSLYVVDINSSNQPISIIDDIPLDDTSNNFNVFPEDYWLEGFKTGGDDLSQNSCSAGGLCANNIQSWLDLLTLPFDFLKSLNKNSCVPINIPVPHSNNNIRLNCLSSVFQNILGQNFYNIILYVISGLIAYRITLKNIDTITDVIDPNDDKIEVVDL